MECDEKQAQLIEKVKETLMRQKAKKKYLFKLEQEKFFKTSSCL